MIRNHNIVVGLRHPAKNQDRAQQRVSAGFAGKLPIKKDANYNILVIAVIGAFISLYAWTM